MSINGADVANSVGEDRDQGKENGESILNLQQLISQYQQEYNESKESPQKWMEHWK